MAMHEEGSGNSEQLILESLNILQSAVKQKPDDIESIFHLGLIQKFPRIFL